MPLPATVTTNLFPDHKNSPIGPHPRITQIAQETGTTNNTLGQNSANEALLQSFAASDGPLLSFDVYMLKTGSPTDQIVATLYEFDELSDTLNTVVGVLATSLPLPGSTLTTSAVWRRFVFPAPYTLNSALSPHYAVVLERSGAVDGTNHYLCQGSTSNPYADGQTRKFSSEVWVEVTNTDLRFRANIGPSARYQFAVDKSNNKARCYKSTDNLTWTEQDSANAPAISSTSTLKSISTVFVDQTISVFVITSSTRLDIFNYNTATDTWGSSAFNTTSPTFNTNVAGVAPLSSGVRLTGTFSAALSDYIFVNNGATETVMGNPRRRAKLARRLVSDGTWAIYDLAGSANTPDSTLPGNAVDYDLRTGIVDGNGVFHAFLTSSDSTALQHRSFALNNTFATINNVGSGITLSSSAAYPVSAPCNFYKSGEWWIAIAAAEASALKVARCKASLASTSGNWTVTTASAIAAEQTNSNPAVLMADNADGGKLYLFYTKSDGKLYFTHDSGSNTWVAEQEWRPGTKTIAGLSGGSLANAIGIGYLDTSPTPDEIRFDQTEVFF